MSVYIADKSQITRHIPSAVGDERMWVTPSDGEAPTIRIRLAPPDEKMSSVTAAVSWLTVKVSSILSSDEAVGAALYEKIINQTITPYELRSHTRNQLYCLLVKLSMEPSTDTDKRKAITQLFERAMCNAHRDGDSEEMQVALWDLYTLEHMQRALAMISTTIERRRDLVAERIANVFTTLVCDSQRRNWLKYIERLDVAVRHIAMRFWSDEETARVTSDKLKDLPAKQQAQLLQFR